MAKFCNSLHLQNAEYLAAEGVLLSISGGAGVVSSKKMQHLYSQIAVVFSRSVVPVPAAFP